MTSDETVRTSGDLAQGATQKPAAGSGMYFTVMPSDATAEEIYEAGLELVRRAHGLPPGAPIPQELMDDDGEDDSDNLGYDGDDE